jgi:hypothetical protein
MQHSHIDNLDHPDQQPWRLASLLIQPALIRLFDQIRKQLEESDWQGSYETKEIWPAGVDPSTTEPQVLYLLYLSRGQEKVRINVWELCYQICFIDYAPTLDREDIADFQVGEVVADASLIAADGEVDWNKLDRKAQQVVTQMLNAARA